MVRAHLFLIVALMALPFAGWAQIGGKSAFSFLELPTSARVTASGDDLITVHDGDVNLAYQNPALLNPSHDNTLSASSVLHPGRINHGYAGYGRHYPDVGTFHAGMKYIAYGTFQGADRFGNKTNEFTAGEYALTLGGSKHYYDRYSFGANLKLIYSQVESYSSFGFATDFGATFHDTTNMWTASLVLRNIGYQVKPFVEGNREPLPFDLRVGVSKRLQYLPFRLNITAHHLHKPDIRYDDPAQQEQQTLVSDTASQSNNESNVVDQIARHFIVSGEFYIAEIVRLRLGYNHLRRQEFGFGAKKGLAGFSFGAAVTINKITVSYGRSQYHPAGGTNHFTVSADLNAFLK